MENLKKLSRAEMKKVLGGANGGNGCPTGQILASCDLSPTSGYVTMCEAKPLPGYCTPIN